MLFGRNKGCRSGCKDASRLYPPEFFNKKLEFEFQDFSFQNTSEFIGKGHYSSVYKSYLSNGTAVAVKNLVTYSKKYLGKEINTLKALQDVPNVLRFYGFIGNESYPTIIYSYHPSSKSGYNGNITLEDFRWWLKTTLETLADIHEHGVIHRDLRLANILTDFENRKLAIVDFGLSDFYRKGVPMNPRVGCFHITAPELAINVSNYNCEVDVWSLGLSCLDIMIKLKDHWNSKNDYMMIENLIKAYGSASWNEFVGKYNPIFKTNRKISGSFYEFGMPGNNHLITPDTMDLVSKMLELDPAKRISAREALNHNFFK
ncbi:CMGC family protein kinase [Trichomonas vaginalis G3]|uniref:non-specific serine/threonine protein kinase n=1 Tax=Trichomonas vaginalis (strain ATCC PRA-98 / G3) TaxID=412133 RepID=A2EBL9_TRIV3|nr:protein serine/threonine kinase protein [Trichomonas vaginalis G3]EAY09936.1 CMGC family protein kinase [Trichomonas vaginalis G3]KAI5523074.1 protein serine/threonine kinase protein [Trichomonas vaginalis G3]|eukprot:XP_001322159.1 CMGC family protein kinase [Trichomonas vaginalis G3]